MKKIFIKAWFRERIEQLKLHVSLDGKVSFNSTTIPVQVAQQIHLPKLRLPRLSVILFQSLEVLNESAPLISFKNQQRLQFENLLM